MRIKTLYGGALVLFGVFVFPSLGFSVSSEPQSKKAKQMSPLVEKPAALAEGKGKEAVKAFGSRIVGTYIVAREPDAGTSRILTIFADGNLSSIQSIQFNGGAAGGGFSNQQGVWKRVGPREIRATVLDLSYDFQTGDFLGMTAASYDLQFDKTFQAVTGTVAGNIFSPGIDPLNPGDAEPIDEFTDTFEAQRVIVDTSADEEGG
ncbi:MAG TPA: hypothetical protein ACFYD0_02210 [Candidatus Wunengus sp. YC65]|uniref:hypothetical protein n=1 Tax=Candidatus Wunengus sp. YC65 TaxID=3367701 RepID=UPI004029DE97